MENVQALINDFFKKRLKSDLSIAQVGSLQSWSGTEAVRAKLLQSVDYVTWTIKSDHQYSLLRGKIYQISGGRVPSVIFALYEDESVLWLDDHSSNKDFSNFAAHEELFTWIPERLHALAMLITETKFNFLGEPRLIVRASDIPPFPDELKSPWIKDGHDEVIMEMDKRLATVSNEIKPPESYFTSEDTAHLNFFIWTKQLGRIYAIQCSWELGGMSFDYQGEKLVDEVGNFVVPR